MTAVFSPPRTAPASTPGFEQFVAREQVALRRYAVALTGNHADADADPNCPECHLARQRVVRRPSGNIYCGMWKTGVSCGLFNAEPGALPSASTCTNDTQPGFVRVAQGAACSNTASGHGFTLNRAGATLR